MTPAVLSCPACQSTLRVPGTAPGKRFRCPKCGEVFSAPTAPKLEPIPETSPLPTDGETPDTSASAADPIATPETSDPQTAVPPQETQSEEPKAKEAGTAIPTRPRAKPVAAPKDVKILPRTKNPRRNEDRDRNDRPPARSGLMPLLIVGGVCAAAFVLLAFGAGAFVYWRHLATQKAEEAARVEQEAIIRDRNWNQPVPPPFVPNAPELPNPPRNPDPRPPFIPPVEPPVTPPVVPPFNPPVPVRPPVEPTVVKPKLVFPPVVPVPLKPAPLTEAKTELKLPGTVTDACIGGGGRYWCLLLGDSKQIAVFDVNEAKVVKFLPVAGGKMRIAAGMNKLVVAYPDTGALTRFDLTRLEKEVTVQSPVGNFDSVLLGSASAGPVFFGRTPVDLQTFKALETPDFHAGNNGRWDQGMHYRISPDGHAVGSWSTSSTSGVTVTTFGETAVKPFGDHTSGGFVLPAADGTTVTAAGVYGPTGQRLTGPTGYFFRMPAQEGKFYLTIPGGGGAQINTGMGDVDKPTVVYSTGEARALVNLPNVALPAGNEAWAPTDFLADKKVLFTTTGQLIAVLAPSGDKLILHKFDLEAALDKAGVDYLFVVSRPPAVVPGKEFKYTPEVKSKKGGVKVKLDAGPAGMKVTDGTVTWNVPSSWSGGESVILTVTDKSGQEVFHTFTVTTGGRDPMPPATTGPVVLTLDPTFFPPGGVKPGGAKPGLVRAAAKPMALTATKAADKTEIKLPGTVDLTCFGGGGRFVILRIPSEKKVAVLDVCEGKVVKYLPLSEDNALIAAGNGHLFILAPTANVIQRWSLTTFEKEATVTNPLAGAARQILVGHATDGPLFVVGPNRMLDPKTFKELDLGEGAKGRGMGAIDGHPAYPPTVRISADGRVFAWWTQGLSPSGLSSMVLGDTGAKSFHEHTTVGAIMPGPDGTLFTGGGLFTPELKPVGDKGVYQYWHHVPVPAAHGKLYLSIAPDNSFGASRAAPKVSLKLPGENKVLADLSGWAGLDVPKDNNQTMARGLQLHDRVFLVPDAKAAAVLHAAANKVTIHAFDTEALLAKAGIDYLFVVSRPPGAVRGETFSYKPEVKSRKGGVKIKLDAGPDGMKMGADGTVTWAVPKNFNEASVSVILTVSDSSGQETFHSFVLPVASRP